MSCFVREYSVSVCVGDKLAVFYLQPEGKVVGKEAELPTIAGERIELDDDGNTRLYAALDSAAEHLKSPQIGSGLGLSSRTGFGLGGGEISSATNQKQ